jgi:hypothetical protein
MSVSRDGGASNAVEPSLLGFVDSSGGGKQRSKLRST